LLKKENDRYKDANARAQLLEAQNAEVKEKLQVVMVSIFFKQVS
jgi:hypothetical protein